MVHGYPLLRALGIFKIIESFHKGSLLFLFEIWNAFFLYLFVQFRIHYSFLFHRFSSIWLPWKWRISKMWNRVTRSHLWVYLLFCFFFLLRIGLEYQLLCFNYAIIVIFTLVFIILQNFNENPFFEGRKLTKTYTFLDEGTKITATPIKWKEGMVRA